MGSKPGHTLALLQSTSRLPALPCALHTWPLPTSWPLVVFRHPSEDYKDSSVGMMMKFPTE